MKVFIDGSALLRYLDRKDDPIVVPGDNMKSRAMLARWLARYAEVKDCDVVIVFDDNPPGRMLPHFEHCGRTKVVNMGPDEKARQEIAGPANRSAQTEATQVVTDDAKLRKSLEGGRAEVLDPPRFMAKARALFGDDEHGSADEPYAKFAGLSDEEVDFWAQLLDEDDGSG